MLQPAGRGPSNSSTRLGSPQPSRVAALVSAPALWVRVLVVGPAGSDTAPLPEPFPESDDGLPTSTAISASTATTATPPRIRPVRREIPRVGAPPPPDPDGSDTGTPRSLRTAQVGQ